MSFTPVPVFIYHKSTPYIPPKCPHCDKELPGWDEPTENTWMKIIIITILATIFTLQVVAGMGGLVEADYGKRCDKWFTKRWHYIFPAWQASCKGGLWLKEEMNKEVE